MYPSIEIMSGRKMGKTSVSEILEKYFAKVKEYEELSKECLECLSCKHDSPEHLKRSPVCIECQYASETIKGRAKADKEIATIKNVFEEARKKERAKAIWTDRMILESLAYSREKKRKE